MLLWYKHLERKGRLEPFPMSSPCPSPIGRLCRGPGGGFCRGVEKGPLPVRRGAPGALSFGGGPVPARTAYRFRLTTSCNISSEVVMTRALD